MLKEARRLLEAAKNDFHAILGIAHGSSTKIITKAYKELTKVHHPDRHANATEEQKKFHEIKCKDITRAYRLIMEKRARSHSSTSKSNEGRRREEATKKSSEENKSHSKGSKASSGSSTRNEQRHSSEQRNNTSNEQESSQDDSTDEFNEEDFEDWGEPWYHDWTSGASFCPFCNTQVDYDCDNYCTTCEADFGDGW